MLSNPEWVADNASWSGPWMTRKDIQVQSGEDLVTRYPGISGYYFKGGYFREGSISLMFQHVRFVYYRTLLDDGHEYFKLVWVDYQVRPARFSLAIVTMALALSRLGFLLSIVGAKRWRQGLQD